MLDRLNQAMEDMRGAQQGTPQGEAQARRGLAFASKFDWAESGRLVERALKEGLSS